RQEVPGERGVHTGSEPAELHASSLSASDAGGRTPAAPYGLVDPDAVVLDDLAVQFDVAAGAQVLDDVPVDSGRVRAPEVFEASAERDVDGAVHFFVEVDVARVAVDAGIAADAPLADWAGT